MTTETTTWEWLVQRDDDGQYVPNEGYVTHLVEVFRREALPGVPLYDGQVIPVDPDGHARFRCGNGPQLDRLEGHCLWQLPGPARDVGWIACPECVAKVIEPAHPLLPATEGNPLSWPTT